MSLNNKLRFVHVVSIWVRVEVPYRYMIDLRHGLEHRVIFAVLVPVGVFFVRSKRAFHNACAEQGHLKCTATKALACARLLKLVVDFLFHLLGCNLCRTELNGCGCLTRPFFQFILYRLQLITKRTKPFCQAFGCSTRRKVLTIASKAVGAAKRCLTAKLLWLLRVKVYIFNHTLRQFSRVN